MENKLNNLLEGFSHASFRAKLIYTFGSLILIIIASFSVIWNSVGKSETILNSQSNLENETVVDLKSLKEHLIEGKYLTSMWVYKRNDDGSKQKLSEYLDKYDELENRLKEQGSGWEVDQAIVLDSVLTLSSIIINSQRNVTNTLTDFDSYEDLLSMMSSEAEIENIQTTTQTVLPMLENLLNLKINEEKQNNVIEVLTTIKGTILLISFIIITVGILASIYLSRRILRPINSTADLIDRVLEGDLTIEMQESSNDEMGQLQQKINRMVGKLKEVLTFIGKSSQDIKKSSQEMKGFSTNLFSGAENQSNSVEQVAASMEEMSSNIALNASNSSETQKLAVESGQGVEESYKSASETLEAMNVITRKISIIGEIARQTNLLALNAAVEAARAGEHGRGFAVVAAEIRKLAERSQTASAEIDAASGRGIEISENSSQLLQGLVSKINHTVDLVQQITRASDEQNVGASQVNDSIQSLNLIVNQNTESASRIKSNSENLDRLADSLQENLSFFKIN